MENSTIQRIISESVIEEVAKFIAETSEEHASKLGTSDVTEAENWAYRICTQGSKTGFLHIELKHLKPENWDKINYAVERCIEVYSFNEILEKLKKSGINSIEQLNADYYENLNKLGVDLNYMDDMIFILQNKGIHTRAHLRALLDNIEAKEKDAQEQEHEEGQKVWRSAEKVKLTKIYNTMSAMNVDTLSDLEVIKPLSETQNMWLMKVTDNGRKTFEQAYNKVMTFNGKRLEYTPQIKQNIFDGIRIIYYIPASDILKGMMARNIGTNIESFNARKDVDDAANYIQKRIGGIEGDIETKRGRNKGLDRIERLVKNYSEKYYGISGESFFDSEIKPLMFSGIVDYLRTDFKKNSTTSLNNPLGRGGDRGTIEKGERVTNSVWGNTKSTGEPESLWSIMMESFSDDLEKVYELIRTSISSYYGELFKERTFNRKQISDMVQDVMSNNAPADITNYLKNKIGEESMQDEKKITYEFNNTTTALAKNIKNGKLSKSINSLLGMEVPPEVADLFRNIVMASYQLQPKRVNDVKKQFESLSDNQSVKDFIASRMRKMRVKGAALPKTEPELEPDTTETEPEVNAADTSLKPKRSRLRKDIGSAAQLINPEDYIEKTPSEENNEMELNETVDSLKKNDAMVNAELDRIFWSSNNSMFESIQNNIRKIIEEAFLNKK